MLPESLIQWPGDEDGRTRIHVSDPRIRGRLSALLIRMQDALLGEENSFIWLGRGQLYAQRKDHPDWFNQLTEEEARPYWGKIQSPAEQTRHAHEGEG